MSIIDKNKDLTGMLKKAINETENNDDNNLIRLLDLDNKGKIKNNMENYILFLKLDPETKGKLKYNSFLERKEFDGKEFDDFIESRLKRLISAKLDVTCNNSVFQDALNNIFSENKYNPVIDYLNNLEWDGVTRVETMFIDWLGAADSPLIKEMTKKWLIAAIKRIYQPGCKFDNMIVLKGPQGGGKSTLCSKLSHGFYNEHIDIDDPKNYVEILNRSWIVCFDELAGLSRKDLSSIKSFLSKQDDTVRLAYGRNPKTYYRKCIFIGSTNEENFLRDYTANIERRFWTIECTFDNKTNIIGEHFTDDIVNQIWAEAVQLYKNDPEQFLDLSYEGIQLLTDEQKKFKISNDDETLDSLKDILLDEYILNSQNEFDDLDDFYNQVNKLSTKQGIKKPLNRIPGSYIKYILKKKFNESRTGTYIAASLKDILEYKTAMYNNRIQRCFCLKDETKLF